MIALVFDTETTGLPLPNVADLDKQPRIIELALARVENGKVISEHEWLIDPECPLPAIITKITGLKDEDLAGKPKFREALGEIEDAFAGADVLIAHNAPFDTTLLEFELKRCARTGFPWPETTLCTVQEFMHLKGRRLKMLELYEMKLGKKLDQKHRALDDVRALCEIVIQEGLA
jgi:DNA polymerase III subunit epsilon